MLSILNPWRNRWLPSEFSRLPVAETADPARSDYVVLAAALAQLLERCTPRGAQRDFGAALRAHRAIRMHLKSGRTPRLPPQLLSDMSHEIALYADRPTRDAALRCLRRCSAARRPAAMQFAGLVQ